MEFVSYSFLVFLALGIVIIVQYFRVVVNERAVFWIRPFAVKVLFGIGNIALFFYVLTEFMHFISQFEDYNYSGVGVIIKDIYPGLSAESYNALRSTTFFVGITTLILIVLFEFRIVYSVFKYRGVPGIYK